MRRRSYLAVVGAASIGGIAGCTDDSDSQDSGAVEGDSQAAGAGVELEVTEVELSHQLVTEEGKRYLPDPGNVFLFISIESRNAGDKIVNLAHRRELRVLVDNEQFEPLKVSDGFTEAVPSGYKEPMSGDTYETVSEARPDVSSSGILAFEISSKADEAELTWAREHEQEEPLYWTLSLNPDSVPQFEIQEINVPAQVGYYSEFEVEFQVTNDGGGGLFERTILVEPTDRRYQISKQIEAGETVVITKTIQYPEGGLGVTESATIRTVFNEETVSFSTPTRRVGEFFTGPDGLKITVSNYHAVDYAARKGSWDTVEYESDSNHRLLLAEFIIENTDSVAREIPRNAYVTLETRDDTTHDIAVKHPTGFSGSYPFIEPIKGDVITESTIQPGNYVSGWTLFEIPRSVNLTKSFLKWVRGGFTNSKYDYLQARWSL